ncbi:MAG: hypothetical protein PHI85_04880 [Victivallaceae bacterium]|nr:hypothetical protein [Victivallaceae bacterium]
MLTIKEISALRSEALRLQLEGAGVLMKYSVSDLRYIYNGIGPDSFPVWLRDIVSALHPSLAVVAFIHDVEWHETDYQSATFAASNDRFKRNGYRVAAARFRWYDPRRWIVMNQARRFGNLCQTFGWSAWCSPCQCEVCKKKAGTR